MLIITRRPGEKIMVGDDVVVEVIEVSGSSVRIGIAAPKSIPVYREEIWAAVETTLGELRARLDQPVAAIGITNQRETTVVWDRRTGTSPYRNADEFRYPTWPASSAEGATSVRKRL